MYEKLDAVHRGFAEKAFGQGDDFAKAMNIFKQEGVETVKIYTIPADSAEYELEERGGNATIVHPCMLQLMPQSDRCFLSHVDNIQGNYAMRGELK